MQYAIYDGVVDLFLLSLNEKDLLNSEWGGRADDNGIYSEVLLFSHKGTAKAVVKRLEEVFKEEPEVLVYGGLDFHIIRVKPVKLYEYVNFDDFGEYGL